MKIKLRFHTGRKAVPLSLALFTMVGTAVAALSFSFLNWDTVKKRSPDTIIVRCTKTPVEFEMEGKMMRLGTLHGLWQSDIDIICVLKGRTNLGPARLSSLYRPRQGENYFIFASYTRDGAYHATEPYRIVPLGLDFPTNILAGKSFEEQIRTLLQYRLETLNTEMQQAQEEKKRLEEGPKQ